MWWVGGFTAPPLCAGTNHSEVHFLSLKNSKAALTFIPPFAPPLGCCSSLPARSSSSLLGLACQQLHSSALCCPASGFDAAPSAPRSGEERGGAGRSGELGGGCASPSSLQFRRCAGTMTHRPPLLPPPHAPGDARSCTELFCSRKPAGGHLAYSALLGPSHV